jgi:hypothetical protein
VKDGAGELVGTAVPKVAVVKDANYSAERPTEEWADDADLTALVQRNLERYPLAGFIVEGHAPYGTIASSARLQALRAAAYSGMPVALVGRGNNEGFTQPQPPFIGGRNLTATKARLLLMACLMRFGSPPPAADPATPTEAERAAVGTLIAEYQKVFDWH